MIQKEFYSLWSGGSVSHSRRKTTSRSRGATKNRGSARRAPKKRAGSSRASSSLIFPHWLNEAFALLIGALALYLCVSVLSHQLIGIRSHLPPELGEYNTGWNFMGPVGHVTATLFTGFMGWSSLVPVAWLFWLSYYLWGLDTAEPRQFQYPWYAIPAGLFGVLFFSCTLGAVLLGEFGGGSLGLVLGGPLRKLFGLGGGSITAGTLLYLSLALASQVSLGVLTSSIFQLSLKTLTFSLWTMPRAVLLWCYESFLFVYDWSLYFWDEYISYYLSSWFESLGALVSRVFLKEEEDSSQKLKVTPTSRKRELSEPKQDIGPELEEVEANVVVSRHTDARRATPQDIKNAKKRALEILQKDKNLAEAFKDYVPPDLKLLSKSEHNVSTEDDELLRKKSRIIESKLRDFNIKGNVTHVHPGPVITLFEFEPAPGVKVGKIAALQDDLAMSLRAPAIRIIAPIPRRGTVGIEIPNKQHETVRLRELLESKKFIEAEHLLTIPIGKDTYGNPVMGDVAKMPHLLMAGATGTGKSVSINAFLLSLLYRSTPAELGLILIDPKVLELSIYDGIPHLRVPVVTDARKAKAVLQWGVNEMERRYKMLQQYGVRSIDAYNRLVAGEKLQDEDEEDDVIEIDETEEIVTGEESAEAVGGEHVQQKLVEEKLQPLPKIVIVIDELADLMLSVGREVEELITRLAQKARAAGIHLIVATQRPSVDVITGLIKANFPARLSFRVTSRVDSRTILDGMGAERLLGRGDMLFMRPGALALQRIHGAFVSDSEVKRVVTFLKKKCKPQYDEKILAMCEKALEEDGASSGSAHDGDEHDPLYDRALALVVEQGRASTSMVQRAFRIGYNRAARIIDALERDGIVGPMDGAKPREVLINQLGEMEGE